MIARHLSAVALAFLLAGIGRAEEYKNAKVIKSEVTGETTLEYKDGDETKTVKVWPYDRMKVLDEKGKETLPAYAALVGAVMDVKTSKKVLKGFEVITEAHIIKQGQLPEPKKPKK